MRTKVDSINSNIKNDIINGYFKKVDESLWTRLTRKLFSTNIDEKSKVAMKKTQFVSMNDKEITIVIMDTLITVEKTDNDFHIELQTCADSNMLHRMIEYACHYALERMTNIKANEFKFPEQTVVYIESNKKIPDFLECEMFINKNNKITYRIPTFKIFDTKIDDFDDDLILFLPFKISELNKDIKTGKNKKQIKERLKAITKKVSERLSDAHNRGILNDNDYYILMNAINFIFTLLFNKVTNYKSYKKEVIEMIKTLTLEEKRQIREEG